MIFLCQLLIFWSKTKYLVWQKKIKFSSSKINQNSTFSKFYQKMPKAIVLSTFYAIHGIWTSLIIVLPRLHNNATFGRQRLIRIFR